MSGRTSKAALLDQARAAYLAQQKAQRELARLKQYRNQTGDMKTDRAKWLAQLSSSNAIIDRILGGDS